MPASFFNPRLRSFLFCMSVKTGCKVIGYLTIFSCTILLLNWTFVLINIESILRACDGSSSKRYNYNYICYDDSKIDLPRFMLISGCVIALLGLISSVLLLYGVRKKSPEWFFLWYVFFVLVLLFTSVSNANNFHQVFLYVGKGTLFHLVAMLIMTYFFIVIKSYKQQLCEERDRGAAVMAVALTRDLGLRRDTSDMQVVLPNTSHTPLSSHPVGKDDPPPPYPGLYSSSNCPSYELSIPPPPYSECGASTIGSPLGDEANSAEGVAPHCSAPVAEEQEGAASLASEDSPTLPVDQPRADQSSNKEASSPKAVE